ncbi:MAG: transglutaminase-like domain-containing protein [Thermoguttaceae bacterium]
MIPKNSGKSELNSSRFQYCSRFLCLICCFVATFCLPQEVMSQFRFGQTNEKNGTDGATGNFGPKLGASTEQIWRTGISIVSQTPLSDVTITIPIPMEWPEQRILRIDESKIEGVVNPRISYRTVNQGAQEMLLTIGAMRPNRPLEVVLEVGLINYELLPPDNSDDYVIPSKVRKEFEQYLKPSPSIQSSDSKFVKLFNQIAKDRKTDWEKVEALYTFVQHNVKYDQTQKTKKERGALAVISDPEGTWHGDCKDMTCLFVALCRAGKIPARVVRVPEHCYAEFYLDVKETVKEMPNEGVSSVRGVKKSPPQGFWFPCQVSGTYSFGGIPERQPILQKGDLFPDRETDGRTKKLFLVECFSGAQESGGPPPKFTWIHEVRGK